MRNNPHQQGYFYAVFGAGRQGTAAVHDLVRNCEASKLLVVEPDKARLAAARGRLSKLLGPRAAALRFAGSATVKDLRGADAVLSCAPYRANLALTKLSMQAGVPFCDLGGNPETVAAQEKLARGKSIAVVPDCGVSPGLSNILAVHCARAHGADTVKVRCGGLPLLKPDAASNPLRYKLVFSAFGLLSEYSGKVPAIRKGKLAWIEALGATERFDEEHESSPTSNNSPQVVRYLASLGVREYDYATVRYDGHWDLVRGWKSLGYLRGDEMKDRELAARLEADPALRYDPARDRDKLVLRVQGFQSSGRLRRGHEYRLEVHADLRTRFSAMELTTCWGITVVAHHMASGRGKPRGFATPERFVDSGWVIAQIERRLRQLRG